MDFDFVFVLKLSVGATTTEWRVRVTEYLGREERFAGFPSSRELLSKAQPASLWQSTSVKIVFR